MKQQIELKQTNNAEKHGLVASGHIGCHVAVHIIHTQRCDKNLRISAKTPFAKTPFSWFLKKGGEETKAVQRQTTLSWYFATAVATYDLYCDSQSVVF